MSWDWTSIIIGMIVGIGIGVAQKQYRLRRKRNK